MTEKISNKYSYLAKNTVVFAISTFGTKLLSFLLVPLYTDILTTSEYGTADIITTTAFLFCYIFTLNIADAVLRFGIDEHENSGGILLYGMKVVLTGAVIAGAGIALFSIFNPLNWNRYCYAFLFVIYLLSALNDVTDRYLRSIDKIKEVAIANISLTFFTVASNIICLVVLKLGLIGYLLSFAVGYFAALVYSLFVIRGSLTGKKMSICAPDIRKQMRVYSIPLIFNGIIWWMNGSLDRYFLTGICGSDANGLYAVATKIPTLLTVCATIFQQAWGLSAIRGFDREDTDGFFAKTYAAFNAFLVVAASGIILLNVPLARILFSKDFFEAWKYSSVLVISGLFTAMSGFTGSVFTATKNTKIYTVSSVVSVGVNIVLNSVLIPVYGIQGATIATAASFFTIWIMRFILAKRFINWKIHIVRDMICYALLVAQIVFEHTQNHSYLLQIAVFAAVVLLNYKHIIAVVQKIFAHFFGRNKGAA